MRNPVWMLRCAQHDRMGTANLTLWSLSFARRGDGNLTLSLCDVPLLAKGEGCFGESQNRVRSHGLPSTFLSFRAFSFVIPSALFCHSERSEESIAWMLRCAQHDRTESVIPSASEESSAWVPCKRKETFAKQTGGGQSRAWISSRLQRKTPQRTLNT